MKGLFWKTLKKEQVRFIWFISLLVVATKPCNMCVCGKQIWVCERAGAFIVPTCV